MSEPDRVLRHRHAGGGDDPPAGGRRRSLAAAGIACENVSAGGTGTYDLAAATARVTESQAGSYVVMDGFLDASLVDRFPVALDPARDRRSAGRGALVLDAGRRPTATDLMKPRLLGHEAETASVSRRTPA